MSSRSTIRRFDVRATDAAMAAIDGRQPPGKTIGADEVVVQLGPLVAGVLDGDGLQRHPPAVGEQPGAGGEELVVPAPVDRLDHLDGNERVVAPSEVAVVGTEDGHPVGETPLGHSLLCQANAGPRRSWSW